GYKVHNRGRNATRAGDMLADMSLLADAASGRRLSAAEALALHDLPLFDVAAAAHEVRLARTDPQTVSYLIDRNVNYSNVCNVGCSFCGFYRTRRQMTRTYSPTSRSARSCRSWRPSGARAC